MEVISLDKKEAFASLFPKDLRDFVLNGFKFFIIQDSKVFFSPAKDKEFMIKHKEYFLMKGSLLPKMKEVFNVEEAVVVKDEKAFFLEKVIEIAAPKEIIVRVES